MWDSCRLVLYAAGGEPSGGITNKKLRGGVRNARRFVAHAAGMGNDEGVRIGGTSGAPSLLVVAENAGERRITCRSRCTSSLPPPPYRGCSTPLLPTILPAVRVGDVALLGGVVGAGDVASPGGL